MAYSRPAWVEVNLGSIKQNISSTKNLLKPQTLVMAVVKADGYGHGAVEVAKAAMEAGADRLGVALPEELVELREAGIKAPVHLLGDITEGAAQIVVENDGIASICGKSQAEELNKYASQAGKRAKVHVKIDTGMNRLGVKPDKAADLLINLKALDNIEAEGIFTHFSTADQPGSEYANRQLNKFMNLIDALEKNQICPPVKHCANSAAALLMTESHLDMVRLGISIYGLYPSEPSNYELKLIPALSLKSKISRIAVVAKGDGVSYGITFKPDKDCKIATLPLGYADGYTRLLSNKGEVLIGGRRCRVAGVVTMDQFMVILPDDLEVEVGDEAVIIGKQQNDEIIVDEIAQKIGTINYEIVCMLSKRLPRIYI